MERNGRPHGRGPQTSVWQDVIVLDSTFLILALDPDPKGSAYGVDHPRERVQQMLETMENDSEIATIPAPVLAEFLTGVTEPDWMLHIKAIKSSAVMRVEPFAERAAIECARLGVTDDAAGIRGGTEPYQKVKVDRQIIAVAKAADARAIATHDEGLANVAERHGIEVIRLSDLELPPEQLGLLGNEPPSDP